MMHGLAFVLAVIWCAFAAYAFYLPALRDWWFDYMLRHDRTFGEWQEAVDAEYRDRMK